jgi:hypothetical protein
MRNEKAVQAAMDYLDKIDAEKIRRCRRWQIIGLVLVIIGSIVFGIVTGDWILLGE